MAWQFLLLSYLGLFSSTFMLSKLLQFRKDFSFTFSTLLGIVILFKLSQLLNAPDEIILILSGIIVFWQPIISAFVFVSMTALQLFQLSYLGFFSSTIMLPRLLQPSNTEYSISCTFLGIVIFFKMRHNSKALYSILTTLEGIKISVKLSHP